MILKAMTQLIRRIVIHIFILVSFQVQVTSAEDSAIRMELSAVLSRGFSQNLKAKIIGQNPVTVDSNLLLWYQKREFQPIWHKDGETTEYAYEIKKVIEDIFHDGLNPEDYFHTLITERLSRNDIKSKAELDILLTLASVQLASDARYGRFVLKKADTEQFEGIKVSPPDLNLVAGDILSPENIGQSLRSEFPIHKQYKRMKAALETYRQIQAAGGWGVLPTGITPLRPGDKGSNVILLTKRLKASGDFPSSREALDVYDIEVEVAVKNFQSRHGIPVTGQVYEKTLAALNVPVEERITALLINLERWRWLSRNFSEGKEIYVNIAGYELFAIENSIIKLRLPVIVGKAYHATPVFTELIKYIEFNPYWNVPPSIAANEILPDIKKNLNYLSSQHMKLYDKNNIEISPSGINWAAVSKNQMRGYAVKQLPGTWNVLGALKFVFPNKYSVYLHDTGSPGLFAKDERALSHGCIRVSNPKELAVFLLNNPEDRWDRKRVEELISQGKNLNVMLKEPIRLYLTYRTAWVELDGTINFRPDIYKRDKRMISYMSASK